MMCVHFTVIISAMYWQCVFIYHSNELGLEKCHLSLENKCNIILRVILHHCKNALNIFLKMAGNSETCVLYRKF